MVKTLAIVGMMAATTACMAQTGRYRITGHIDNLPDSVVLGLYKPEGDLLKAIASDTIVGGVFYFSDTISQPVELNLSGASAGLPSSIARVWVRPGTEVTVTGEGPLFPLWNYCSDEPLQASQAAFNGAVSQELAKKLLLDIERTDQISYLYGELHGGTPQQADSIWSIIRAIDAQDRPLNQIIQEKTLQYMGTAPVDEVWLDELASFAGTAYSDADSTLMTVVGALYSRLTPEQRATPQGEAAGGYLSLDPIVQEGDPIADGVLYDAGGTTHSLAELKGKYILLDFWSRGCGPCVASLPELHEVAAQYAGRMTVVSISTDMETLWKDYISTHDMPALQWNELTGDRPGLSQRYGVDGVPYYVLISPDGIVMSKWDGYGKGSLKKKLSSLLPDPS